MSLIIIIWTHNFSKYIARIVFIFLCAMFYTSLNKAFLNGPRPSNSSLFTSNEYFMNDFFQHF